jgi:hypothetical protein
MKRIVRVLSALTFAGTLSCAPHPPGGGSGRPNREEIFKMLDTNGDGGISLDEFKAHRPPGASGEGADPSRPSPEEVFRKIDTNGDGFLSLEEFKAHRPPRGSGGPPRER